MTYSEARVPMSRFRREFNKWSRKALSGDKFHVFILKHNILKEDTIRAVFLSHREFERMSAYE